VEPDLAIRPELRLEVVRESFSGNQCNGRGQETASGRGYNVERLARAVFNESKAFFVTSCGHFDHFCPREEDVCFQIECKSCVFRYPSGGYGRFRIWRHHHEEHSEQWSDFEGVESLYFFVVYTVKNDVERELGKLVVPAVEVDNLLDSWTEVDHPTMGQAERRDLSWNMLLQKLGVSHEEFKTKDIVNLTKFGTVGPKSESPI